MKTKMIFSTLCALILATGSALAGPWNIRNQGPEPLTAKVGQKVTVHALVTYRTRTGEQPAANGQVWVNVYFRGKNTRVNAVSAGGPGNYQAEFQVPQGAVLGQHPTNATSGMWRKPATL